MSFDGDPNALRAGHRIAGYEILRVLGAGGFGITYEAESPITGKHVAIKEFFPRGIASRESATRIIYSSRDQELVDWALKRFETSTTDQSKLRHPNIVEVIHYIKENDTGYMIMEYVEGKTLEHWLRERETPPSVAEMRLIMEPILDALEYLHSLKLIHRDIAPDNIMVRPDGRPIIIDFGAIKLIERQTQIRSSTNRSFMVSKQFYSPPEQVRDNYELDARADVYATGATLYRAFAGRPPANAEERTQNIALGEGDPFKPINTMTKVLPPEVANVIDRALAFRRDDRVGSIGELREALGWGKSKFVTVAVVPDTAGQGATAPGFTAAGATAAGSTAPASIGGFRAPSSTPSSAPVLEGAKPAAKQDSSSPLQFMRRWLTPAIVAGTLAAALVLVLGLNPAKMFSSGNTQIVTAPPPTVPPPRIKESEAKPVPQELPKQQPAQPQPQPEQQQQQQVTSPPPVAEPKVTPPAPPPVDPVAEARRDYELAVGIGTKEALNAFLQRHPKGFYADLARGQLAKIAAQESKDLARRLNAELTRVGCAAPAGEIWTDASQRALTLFNQHAQTKFDVKLASADALTAVREKTARVCPLVCAQGQRAQGDTCVTIAPPPAQQKQPQVRQQQQQPQQKQAAPRGGRQTVCGTTGCHQGEVYNAGDPRTKNKNCTIVPSGINRGGAGQTQVVCN